MAAFPSHHTSRLVSLIALLAAASIAPERPRTSPADLIGAGTSSVQQHAARRGEAPALPAGVAPDWWTAVQAHLQAEAFDVRPDTGRAAGTYEADNPKQQWRTRFTSAGVAITPAKPPARASRSPRANAPAAETGPGTRALPAAEDWTFGLRLAAYGAGDALAQMPAATPSAEGARVEFRHGGSHAGAPALTEWYVNEARGLEHGFTLAAAPDGAGPVTLELAVTGGLMPALEPDGLAVVLRAPDGAARVRYADLFVTDANGLTLPSYMAVPAGEPARIQLVVDTRGATYPITIDPLATTPATTLTGEAGNDSFGYSVATAGDVNGDGYADVVVGAFGYSSWTGRVYVYQGGSSGLATTPATTLTGQGTTNSFGHSVSTAGDVNGDGYADLVVGAYQYGGGIGRAYVFLGGAGGLLGGLPSGSATMASTILTGPSANDMFGLSVATAGDVNKDGYADIVIGAPRYSPYTGRAFVYQGGPGGVVTAPLTTLNGPAGSWYFGYSVATAGDVNADGYSDVLVGARIEYDTSGQALLYLGGASGLATPAATTLTGEEQDSYFGEPVATAGDVNGDGYADVVIGAWGYASQTGRAYVYLGGASGLATPAATTLTGVAAGDHFGYSVAPAGDLNGDGYADVVIGARGDNSNSGRVYVYLGGGAGLEATAATTLTGAAGEQLGTSVAPAGDVNGDGFADLVVGAIGYSSFTGRAYVYLGGAGNLGTTAATTWTGESTSSAFGASVATAGDVDGDGYADVVVGAQGYSSYTGRVYVFLGGAGGVESIPSTVLTGEATNNFFGRSAATAGDVNGDGYADVVVGARGYVANMGRVYVYLGGASGLSATAATILTGETTSIWFGASVASAGDVNGDGYADVVVGAQNVSSATGRASIYLGGASGLSTTAATTLTGETSGSSFGVSVAPAGDVNGDGYGDVVVGASGHNSVTGRAYVFLGGPGGLATTAATTLTGEAINNYFGESVATAGDVNGDGYADVVVGAYGYSSGTGRAYVYLGGASGLAAVPATTLTGEAAQNNLGMSAATAGDVNGDGYADVVVGAQGYSTGTGRAYVFLGCASGLPSGAAAATASTILTGGATSTYFGRSVASAGDANGDGYADVVIGAYGYSSQTGRADVHAGNGRLGVSLAPRTRRADDAGPVAFGGRSDSANSFRLTTLGRSPFGPTQVKLEWEVKPVGTLFDGSGTGRSADWQDTTAVGASLSELASGLMGDTPYHWRVRVRYHPGGNPFSQSSRWMTQPWVGSQEARIRTKANSAPTAAGVSIAGAPIVGQVLTGAYTYGDVDGDAEGTSTFRWLRGGIAIAGATAITYVPGGPDSGQTITFEVTPVAAAGASPGAPVLSGGVIIARATPVITWANPAGIVYGTALGATELNATTTVPGVFVYTPPAGTVLNAGPGQPLSVTFTPADPASYTGAAAAVAIDVAKATPAITWANPASVLHGTALGPSQLNATTPVDGTWEYTPAAGTVLAVGTHALSVVFTPLDLANYVAANAGVSLEVLPKARSVDSDFTGDEKSDILWRHATQGDVWLWPMDGNARVSETFVRTVSDTDWEIRGQGDQNGDGMADLLWRHKVTGQIYFWPMDGATPQDEVYVTTVDPAYDIVGTGDFDGDGKSDLLWRHLTNGDLWVWLMDGATPLSQTYVDTVDLAYVVKGVADLDADGTADILFHHQTLGEVWVWRMNGATRLSQHWVGTVPDTGYQIVGVADHTGDGKADLLWHHATLGEVWIWTMDGTTRSAETWVGTVPDTNYQIAGSGDYNGDGMADILWHHATLGEVWVWLMDGTTKLSETWVATVPDTGYQIVK